MPFQKGQSGNPTGRKKALGLSRAVRASEGLKTWAKLLGIRDGLVLERKDVGVDAEGVPIVVDVVPSVKELRETCRLLLAYCWGTPVQSGTDELEKRIMELEELIAKEMVKPWHSTS
jgi:hypothetical protein